MNKVFSSALEALHDLTDGATIMSGGFGLCGNPENAIAAIAEKGTGGLTVISNNCGTDYLGLGVLLQNRQIVKMISSYVGENKNFETQFLSGELEVELVPQGTLAERIRAGGAGIRAFFTPTGYGTTVADGKETRDFDGVPCVLETGLTADYAIVKAYKGDTHGNLVYRMSARNFNPMMATAGRITIAEVEELVPAGELNADQIHTPGIYVQRIVQGGDYAKPIEQRTTRPQQ
ncbi:MAG: CoA transferase subunit A [Myxococcota bacterium]|nr:CoA transferase subunit A [Myxococcota bacterium]